MFVCLISLEPINRFLNRFFPLKTDFHMGDCKNMLVLVKIAILQSLSFLCLLYGCVSTQILNLRAKINFANMLKLSGNQVIYQIFRQSLTYLQNWFLLSNLISECLHTLLISTKFFIKFLLLDKKWQWLQYCNFHQCQHIFAVARWNHPYAVGNRV